MTPINWDNVLGLQGPELDRERVHQALYGKNVLIAGAGGSVGRALSEALTAFHPKRLTLLDQSEYGLFQLERAFLELGIKEIEYKLLLADTTNASHLSRLFETERPDIVFHAAAFKHVPLAEINSQEVIRNNVGSTIALLKAAAEMSVTSFIHVSTDKAVDPSGVMGMSKRTSEQLVAVQRREGRSRYLSVRLGNILGSSGSFSETLVEDLGQGRAVRVTDKRMKRYFTTLPNVANSLLQSLVTTTNADVLVPKIHVEKSLLQLIEEVNGSALPKIEYIGIRPGEKLFEQLVGTGEECLSESTWFKELRLLDLTPDELGVLPVFRSTL